MPKFIGERLFTTAFPWLSTCPHVAQSDLRLCDPSTEI